MKYGRLPRKFNPAIPHYSALRMGLAKLAAPPPSVDYTVGLPANLGMFGNDALGDCTCAAIYHALQVWSNAASTIDTEADSEAVSLYEGACGYNPADPKTDQGGDEQTVLTYVMLTGAPVAGGVHRLTAFVEVDPSNQDDVKVAIYTCGLVYIGFNVPTYINQAAGSTWDVEPGQASIEGGHAVVLCGYDASGVTVISWGALYKMTWAFFAAFVDEVYAIADPDWIKATGLDPLGMSMADLETQMNALREANQS
jgi:hypothetical protein